MSYLLDFTRFGNMFWRNLKVYKFQDHSSSFKHASVFRFPYSKNKSQLNAVFEWFESHCISLNVSFGIFTFAEDRSVMCISALSESPLSFDKLLLKLRYNINLLQQGSAVLPSENEYD